MTERIRTAVCAPSTDLEYDGLRESLRLHLELYGKECEHDCYHSACWAIKGIRRRLAFARGAVS